MPVDLDERGRALENDYFRRKDEELIEKLRSKTTDDQSVALDLGCPKCEGKLYETDYENVKIDICDTCGGVWFDAGELARVADKSEKGGWLSRLFD